MPSVNPRRRDYIKNSGLRFKNITIYHVTIPIKMSKYTIDIPLNTNSMYFIRSLELYKLSRKFESKSFLF